MVDRTPVLLCIARQERTCQSCHSFHFSSASFFHFYLNINMRRLVTQFMFARSCQPPEGRMSTEMVDYSKSAHANL